LGAEGVERLTDPRGLPVLWMLAATWLALAEPLAFAFDRHINMAADRFSLKHAGAPDGLAEALVRENGLAPVDPTWLQEWVACTHPGLKTRLAQAMAWKAGRGGGRGTTFP
jgi:STE24 endopeptidase